ncbi:MAG: hypothetical protein ACPGXI_17055 [Mycobacterium sp.]
MPRPRSMMCAAARLLGAGNGEAVYVGQVRTGRYCFVRRWFGDEGVGGLTLWRESGRGA